MKLTDESTQKLADTIAHDVFEVLSTDGRYLDGVMNSIEPAITEVIGKSSPELIGELGALIMDKITVMGECNPYAKHNIWKTRYEALYNYVKRTYAESYIDGAEYGMSHYIYEDVN